jgi:anti-sigma28 factor (negative regulator of flagellin synthesis)
MRLQLDSGSAKLADTSQAGAVAPSAKGEGGVRRQDTSGAGDRISLSGPSTILNRLAEERSARVQQIAAAVRDGSYRASSAATGAAIVAHASS